MSRRTIPVLLTALALLGGLVVAAPARASRPLVLLYGDSLVFEAQLYAEDVLDDVAQVDHQVIGVPGAATCDLLPKMREDAARRVPALVIIAFTGNSRTPCMADGHGGYLTGAAHIAKYEADTAAAIATFRRGAPPVWVTAGPISLLAQTRSEDGDRRMADMLRRLERVNRRVHAMDAGAAVLDGGWYTHTLPCLPKEPCTGGVDARGRRVNVVRAPDGAHLCPVWYPVGTRCPTYASGGLRYALGLLVQPLQSLGLYDARRAEVSLGAGWSPGR